LYVLYPGGQPELQRDREPGCRCGVVTTGRDGEPPPDRVAALGRRQAHEETAVNFEFTEAGDVFRAELRGFLAARLPP
jgi:hypothetical protein